MTSSELLHFNCPHLKRGTKRLLRDIDFSVKFREIVGIYGANGSGKTSLLSAIGLRWLPKEAEYQLFETSVGWRTDLRSLRQRIGQQLQSNPLQGDLTVKESLQFVASIRTGDKQAALHCVDQTLTEFALVHRQNQLTSDLNGGARARVSLAMACVGLKPGSLILSDEPIACLDSKAAKDASVLLRNQCHRYGHSVVVIAHELAWLRATCHRIMVISDRRLVELRDRGTGILPVNGTETHACRSSNPVTVDRQDALEACPSYFAMAGSEKDER